MDGKSISTRLRSLTRKLRRYSAHRPLPAHPTNACATLFATVTRHLDWALADCHEEPSRSAQTSQRGWARDV